jgi:hypothetical protein
MTNVSNTLYSLCLTGDFVTQSASSHFSFTTDLPVRWKQPRRFTARFSVSSGRTTSRSFSPSRTSRRCSSLFGRVAGIYG